MSGVVVTTIFTDSCPNSVVEWKEGQEHIANSYARVMKKRPDVKEVRVTRKLVGPRLPLRRP